MNLKRTYKILSFCILIVFILTIVLACGKSPAPSTSGPAPKTLEKIKLCEVVHSIFYAPQYVAITQGFFKEEGLDIELSTGQGADKVMTALLSNTADIGLAGPETTIYVFNQGKEDYVLNFAQLTKRDGSFLVGRNIEPAFKWEKLNGKTIIGGRPGGVPEMVLEYTLKKHGLIPFKDVNIITNLQFTATAGAFKGGTGDYVALFEPTASTLEQSNGGHVVASIGLESGEIPYTVFMAKKSYLKNNPNTVQKFTNAIYKAQIWVKTHSPSEVASAIQSFFPDADMKLLTKVVERYQSQDAWDQNPLMEQEGLDYLQEIIKASGNLEKPVTSSLLINTEFAKKAIEQIK
jgi:NitT/TauT family transport system substrate-binding protein